MLARCPRCDKPYVDTGSGRCPRCGEAAGDDTASDAAVPPSESKTREPAAAAVVVEGGADGPAPERPKRGIPPVPPRFVDGRPAFEDERRSLLSRYFGTLADVCLRPTAFFTHLSREGARGITWFAYASVLVGTALGTAWNLLLLPLTRQLLSSSAAKMRPEDLAALKEAASESGIARLALDGMESQARLLEQLPLLEAQAWTALLLAPLTAFFTIHLVAGLLHFSVQAFRPPSDEPVAYEVTYRFTVYALAPMVLVAIPTVGSLAGIFTLVVLAIAMARLHRLRALGVIGGVLGPVLLLSLVWNQEVLPRAAPHVAARIGVELEAPERAGEDAKDETEPSSRPSGSAGQGEDEAALGALPPTPAPDRDHSVELHEVEGSLESFRVFRSSRGPLEIRHRAGRAGEAEDEDAGARVQLEVRVRNAGDRATGIEVEHPLVEGLVPGSVMANGAALPDPAPGAPVRARFARLAPGDEATLTFQLHDGEPRALLQVGPTVVLEGP